MAAIPHASRSSFLVVFLASVSLSVSCGGSDGGGVTPTQPELPSSAKQVVSFSFLQAANPGLSFDVTGQIVQSDITVLVPRSVDATSLTAAFALSNEATLRIGGVQQIAGQTANDFTDVIRYTVRAENQSEKPYSVYLGRLLEEGEILGWQRNTGMFRHFADPRDIILVEELRVHLDSTWSLIADILHATVTDTIRVYIYPTQTSLHDWERTLGWDPQSWSTGTAIGSDLIAVVSANSTDYDMSRSDFLSLVLHEATHSIVATFATGDARIPSWINEGLAGLGMELLADCFPNCSTDWSYQRSLVASSGKPDLETMFDDASVGYAFCHTTVLFIVREYGWDALRAFLTNTTDFSPFGLADSDAFKAQWHNFLDQLLG